MSKLMVTSDLHLGHSSIHKFRPFETAEEHHEIVFDNLASSIGKRDSLILLGDIAFDEYWLKRLDEIKCAKKTLILGNHDTERLPMKLVCNHYDAVHSLYGKRNNWFSHVPIHPNEFRGRNINVHGHLHNRFVTIDMCCGEDVRGKGISDERYFNACIEHTDYKPISYADIVEILK